MASGFKYEKEITILGTVLSIVSTILIIKVMSMQHSHLKQKIEEQKKNGNY
jgi:hypothetical protein